MLRSSRARKSFVAIVFTYLLDLFGWSIVVPVLSPLLIDPKWGFFAPETSMAVRTTTLGLIFGVFGLVQLIAAPILGTISDRYGRRPTFLITVGLSIIGYAILGFGVVYRSIALLFLGRIWTGICSGNRGLSQSATADITDKKERSKAFGILIGIGSTGPLIGTWLGGKLADPRWFDGSLPFFVTAAIAVVNLLIVWFLFSETLIERAKEKKFLDAFKEISIVFQAKRIRSLLFVYFSFINGWVFIVVFSATFFVQKFHLHAGTIGDFYAYMCFGWLIGAAVLSRWLHRFGLKRIFVIASLIGAAVITLWLFPKTLWPYSFLLPVVPAMVSLAWTNLSTLVSHRAPADAQGRVLGTVNALWSLSQAVVPIIAGPLAALSLYLPLSLGGVSLLLAVLLLWGLDREENVV